MYSLHIHHPLRPSVRYHQIDYLSASTITLGNRSSNYNLIYGFDIVNVLRKYEQLGGGPKLQICDIL